MKTLLVAASSAAALNAVTLADVVASRQTQKLPQAIVAAEPVVTGNQPTTQMLEKSLSPAASQANKWSWIPAQRNQDGTPQTQIVAIPVPSPGAAALIGLSGLIFTRRRASA